MPRDIPDDTAGDAVETRLGMKWQVALTVLFSFICRG
jgi:hypothetical protein